MPEYRQVTDYGPMLVASDGSFADATMLSGGNGFPVVALGPWYLAQASGGENVDPRTGTSSHCWDIDELPAVIVDPEPDLVDVGNQDPEPTNSGSDGGVIGWWFGSGSKGDYPDNLFTGCFTKSKNEGESSKLVIASISGVHAH
jgi:hypothetical protein